MAKPHDTRDAEIADLRAQLARVTAELSKIPAIQAQRHAADPAVAAIRDGQRAEAEAAQARAVAERLARARAHDWIKVRNPAPRAAINVLTGKMNGEVRTSAPVDPRTGRVLVGGFTMIPGGYGYWQRAAWQQRVAFDRELAIVVALGDVVVDEVTEVEMLEAECQLEQRSPARPPEIGSTYHRGVFVGGLR